MARDLASSGRLVGLSRDEVLALLGPPEYDDPSSVAYTVDMGFRFVSERWTYRLTIHFGKASERVEQVSLHD